MTVGRQKNLLNIIIVEDKILTAKHLATIVDWEELGFNVSAVLYNGKSAKDYIDKNPVDCILCDIELPYITGLELAKYVHENYPHIKVSLISAFRNFEYAQEAMNYNIVNYITKPIVYDSFINSVITLRDKALSAVKHDFVPVSSERLEKMLTDCLGGIKCDFSQFDFSALGFSKTPDECYCAVVSVTAAALKNVRKDDFNQILKLDSDNLFTFVFKFGKNVCEIIAIDKTSKTSAEFNERLVGYTENLFENLKRITDINAGVYIEKTAGRLNDLKEEINSSFYTEQQVSFILLEINTQSVENLMKKIDDAEARLTLEDDKKKFYRYLFMQIYKLLDSERQAYFNKSWDFFSDTKGVYGSIKSMLSELKNSESENSIINDAILYINKNFEKKLTLTEVAAYASLNSQYFSRLFKKTTGTTFVNYLAQKRLDYSKELLIKTNLKISLIAKKSGFSDAQYFHKIFKLETGITPLEYRLLKGENHESP